MEAGRRAQQEGRHTEAADLYRQTLEDCEGFAEAHYRLGKSYEAMQQPDRARAEYYKAVQYDHMPVRASPEQNDFIRQLAKEPGIYVVDAVHALEEEAGNGLVGFNLMADGHHPNVKGYLAVSRLVAESAIRIAEPHPRDLAALSEEEEEAELIFGIDRERMFQASISLGRWFTRMATWRYDPTDRLRLAEEHFSDAVRLDPEHAEGYIGLAMVGSLRGDTAGARAQLARAGAVDKPYVERYLREPWVVSVLDHASVMSH
jgi:tetratricopeptide (TPR) repeat protein